MWQGVQYKYMEWLFQSSIHRKDINQRGLLGKEAEKKFASNPPKKGLGDDVHCKLLQPK